MKTSEYQVTGMTCGHCESAVNAEVSQVAGVGAVDVSAASGRLVVTSSDVLDDDAILAAVTDAGYRAARI